MTEIADIHRVLVDRVHWGRGYNNWALESKRRSAILWLRYMSKGGWCLDRIMGRRK